MFYKFFSRIIKIFFGNAIICKPLKGFSKVLYYEKGQHLTFLFQQEITYENQIWEKIKKYINPEDLVIDIDSNMGRYALRFV